MPMRYLLLIISIFTISSAHALPEIETWTTENGLKVLFVESTELPIVDLALTFNAGSARDTDLPGLSVLTHGLLDKGAADMDADAIASKFEDVGAQFSASVDLDRSSVTLRSLSDESLFSDALNTFITVVSKPSFPQRDFEREQKRLLISLEDQEQRPAEIVSRAFYASLYAEHPYAQPTHGDKESVEKIALTDVRNFHQKHFIVNNAILAIVGDLSRARAEAVANKISQSLPDGGELSTISSVQSSKPSTEHIEFPSQQAHVRIGQVGIERGNPDYFTLYVGNHILGGGGFTSRLVEEVRSKRGLSYSVYSYFIPLQQAGPFMLGLQTRADQAQQAIEVCNQVLNDYIENGPTEEELVLSKKSIISGFPLRIDSNRDVLGYLSMIGYYDLPLTYLQDFTKNIEQVSLQDIKRAFRKHVSTNSFVTIVVGSEQAS